MCVGGSHASPRPHMRRVHWHALLYCEMTRFNLLVKIRKEPLFFSHLSFTNSELTRKYTLHYLTGHWILLRCLTKLN
jgi:hypothetical protein